MVQCAARSKQTGEQCQRHAMRGARVCYIHGGKTPKGISAPQFVTGRYSKYLPGRLVAKYQEATLDPELLNMRHDVALIDARLSDLLTRVDRGEAGKVWEQARHANDDLLKALNNDNYALVYQASQELDRLIGAGLTDHEAWREIRELVEQRRKLVEAEQRRLAAMEQMMTSEQAMTLIAALAASVKKHVTDRNALAGIQADLTAFINAGTHQSVIAG